MKRFILLAVLFLAGFSAFGQDIITKKDGTDIQAKILEVTPNEVKFKKTSNPDGPVFTMLKSDILIVRYANGENEVFDVKEEKPINLNTTFAVVPGMMYNDYKDFYDTHEYVRQPGDPYNPFWIGFGDFFIPGLGNAITGEWGRAAGFFFTNLGLSLIAMNQVTVTPAEYGYLYDFTGLYWVVTAARVGLNIWSVWDAVHVAKAKNMYNQDLRAQRASLDFNVEPYFAYTPYAPGAVKPVAGLSFKVNF